MEDEHLIYELKQVSNQKDEASQTKHAYLIRHIKQRIGQYQQSNQHWRGISLLSQAREVIAPITDLDRLMALLIGGKAELVVNWADRLRILLPANLLSIVEDDLRQAIKVDPSLPDPYWDLAVINARYHANYPAASRYLALAIDRNYSHPVMTRLEAMIQAKTPPEKVPDTDETRLRQLLLQLAIQAAGLMNSWLSFDEESQDLPRGEADDEDDEQESSVTLQTFGDYVREAKAIAANRNLSEDQYLRILGDSRAITNDSAEYVADLLRHVAESAKYPDFLNQATNDHLQLIRMMAFQHFDQLDKNPVWLRQSCRAAERGLKIINESSASVDPDLHADILIAKGQALYYGDGNIVSTIEAIRCYQNALRLKRQVNNTADVEKMKDILWRQIKYRSGSALFSLLIGGIGEALDLLKVCAEAADDLENSLHAIDIKVSLASVMHQVGQHIDAEKIFHEIIASSPPEATLRDVKFELASIYSETSRPKEAEAIQRQLLDDGGMGDSETTAILWSNYANSLSLLNNFEGARTALENAWELLSPEQKQKNGNKIPEQGARIKMLLADIDVKTGHYADAQTHLESAETLNPTPLGLNSLYFYETKARCLIALNRPDEALQSLDKAIHNFKYLLSTGPSLPSWESLLQQWSRLDVMTLQIYFGSEKGDRFENALLHAESAKGRLSAWLERSASPKGAEQALSLERQVEALKTVKQWLSKKASRRVLSLFGSDKGLGVFNIDDNGQVSGAWIDDFNYDLVRRDIYDPWETLVDQALRNGDPNSLTLAGALTDYLLDLVGTWFWQANPDLAEGGSDLVIIPHRLFRSLPLAHARLPDGKRLSELFETVVINPSLGDLGQGLETLKHNESLTNVMALADADARSPLLFARCEGMLSGAGENLILGSAVTTETLTRAFSHPGILLLSLHGDFDESDPFHSKIFTAEGHLLLHQLLLEQTPIKSRMVVLGVCEAGRFRRSLSDEPIGFPAMLLQGGVVAVLAPTWQVEDFTSFLFVTKLLAAINQGTSIFPAVQNTAHWLRDLTAQSVLEQTDSLMSKVIAYGEQGKIVADALKPRLDAQKVWLQTLKPTERPFRSPLDWAAFQIIGVPPVSVLGFEQIENKGVNKNA